MALDRVLHSSVRYPFDYGFVPNTLAEDGAPLESLARRLKALLDLPKKS